VQISTPEGVLAAVKEHAVPASERVVGFVMRRGRRMTRMLRMRSHHPKCPSMIDMIRYMLGLLIRACSIICSGNGILR
jgi:hypothetical protein